jgi:hypothetical protein
MATLHIVDDRISEGCIGDGYGAGRDSAEPFDHEVKAI